MTAPNNPTPAPGAPDRAGSKLTLMIGASAALAVTTLVGTFEGKRNLPYQDIVGVWTVCYGDTAAIVPGRRSSDAECVERLQRQLAAHAEPVLACVPALAEPAHRQQAVAAISLAYNIGTAGFCRSTAARLFRAGRWRAGCDAFMAWNRAGGRAIAGLTRRRAIERAQCLIGLPT